MSGHPIDARDPFIGRQPLPDYVLKEKVGEGQIGVVYKAIRESPRSVLACKVIPEGHLKDGWQRELEKVALLQGVDHVVQYVHHAAMLDRRDRSFVFVLYHFIDGMNLREYLANPPTPIDLAFAEAVIKCLLEVLHACGAVGISHGDLHEGNILIRNPDPRIPNSPRTIWVTDFGYGGSHNRLQPKDDYRQLCAVSMGLLRKLNKAELNPPDRLYLDRLETFLTKELLETDGTQGARVRNPEAMLRKLVELRTEAERESAAASRGAPFQEPGDYLTAEAVPYSRPDEWKHLFVPSFLAAQELLSKNITVLTGARGCGKTMAFRRLTRFMDVVIGEPSGVPGSDQFIGFYLNCRDFVEAFPWIPRKLNEHAERQLIHYFHLSWFAEVCKTLAIVDRAGSDYRWLDGFMGDIFGGNYVSLPLGADVLAHTRAFLEREKERCRLVRIGGSGGRQGWQLSRMDLLDMLQEVVRQHVSWVGSLPFYLFLDDYTVPIVPSVVQRALNPVIFRRRSQLFFKVSTEAANSFVREGLHGKTLELHQDFELIDLATESLHQDWHAKYDLLDSIFRPRIDRHALLRGKDLGLRDVLGKMRSSNNELARRMRDHEGAVVYQGAEAFVGMWASDIRSMIQLFVDMLREANGDIRANGLPIADEVQNKKYRAQGGEFLTFAESVTDPSYWDRGTGSKKESREYGVRLRKVVEAFVQVACHELKHGKLVKDEKAQNPRQAFRVEIVDNFELPDEAHAIYQGLVRWHLFLQDWRGKSVRGMITPRLYLNRLLLPYANLTFSSHDNIPLTNADFIELLLKPAGFLDYWQKLRSVPRRRKRPKRTSHAEGPSLFDDRNGHEHR